MEFNSATRAKDWESKNPSAGGYLTTPEMIQQQEEHKAQQARGWVGYAQQLDELQLYELTLVRDYVKARVKMLKHT